MRSRGDKNPVGGGVVVVVRGSRATVINVMTSFPPAAALRAATSEKHRGVQSTGTEMPESCADRAFDSPSRPALCCAVPIYCAINSGRSIPHPNPALADQAGQQTQLGQEYQRDAQPEPSAETGAIVRVRECQDIRGRSPSRETSICRVEPQSALAAQYWSQWKPQFLTGFP
jgi:hypothetical protein